ncbi:pirin family protein [Telmatocola sphagniphila]|uniref:Pirin family protein n=1 Tax=Telmatocola sphagniphila TaxID=1123043 RepID=A0A8E6EVC5_9BACT|nr:pirin family protein [Telmatocola sphagniphila]QVL34774.1 pirin family protein [Telmatocola sphagniphila]
MFIKRPADQRGKANFGWLDTRYTFSFADYYDPNHMGFRALRVINEDVVKSGNGFPMHPHRNMEIVTYVIRGQLEHKDSMGNHGIINAGEVQRITAGKGILHSEFNPSSTEDVHLYQIWLMPDREGIDPSYEQRNIATSGKQLLIASPDGRNGSATINRNASITAIKLDPRESYSYDLGPDRHAWVQVIKGDLFAGDLSLKAGDGLAVSSERNLNLFSSTPAEILLFDLD